jgi:hypothetical protein
VHDDDTAWKQILRPLFEPFLEFFFPEIHEAIDWSRGPEFIDTGFERLVPGMKRGGRVTDILAKVRLRDGSTRWLLVHVEVQGAGETTGEFNERVFDCHFLVQHRHQIEAKGDAKGLVSVAVVIDPSASFRPGRHTKRLLGLTIIFEFPVVRLIDYEDRRSELATSPNPFALVTLAHLELMGTRSEDERFDAFRGLLQLARKLYNRGIQAENTVLLVRFLAWILKPSEGRVDEASQLIRRDFEGTTVMEFFTPFEIRALKVGREQGMQVGLAKGEAEGLRKGEAEGLRKGEAEGLRKGEAEGLRKGEAEGLRKGEVEGVRKGVADGLRKGARAVLKRCYGQGGAALVPVLDAIEDPKRLEAVVDAIGCGATLDEIKALIEAP